MNKNKGTFGRSAALLAVIGVVAKLIGALYRVPLTNIVGAEGMGLYQMVFPLYTVLLAFCGGGITSAVSRTVAKYTASGDDGACIRVVKISLVPLLAVSAASVAAVALFRNVIAKVQGNADAATAYLAICPSLLFTGGINVLRGYFQGRANMLPGGISQLIEQSVKLGLGLYLSRVMLPYGVKYGVTGALLGVTASELAALAYLFVRFLISSKRRKRYIKTDGVLCEAASDVYFGTPTADDKTLRKELFSFALSVTLGSLVLPVTQIIDSALVINILGGFCGTAEATAQFGLLVGPVGTLINMPTVLALAVAVAFLPAVTAAIEKGEDAAAVSGNAANLVFLFTVPITAVFLLFPDRVCTCLYSRGLSEVQLVTAARLLRVQALGVFYIGVLQLVTATLQAHNRAHVPVINLLIGACVKVGLTPVLVRYFGITGAAVATTLCYASAALLDTVKAYRVMPMKVNFVRSFVVPAVFSALGAALFSVVVRVADGHGIPYVWSTVTGAAAFAAVYFTGIALFGFAKGKSGKAFSLFTGARKARQRKK